MMKHSRESTSDINMPNLSIVSLVDSAQVMDIIQM